MRKSKIACLLIALMLVITSFTGCNSNKGGNDSSEAFKELTGQELIDAAKKEGKIVSYGMPDEWANQRDIWKSFTEKYGIAHEDTDMSSGEQIAKFKAEADNPVADVGDIGIAFAKKAKEEGVLAPHKNPFWDEIPDWAKDPEGYWCTEYTGTISFLVNKNLVKNIPRSWADLLKPEYKNTVVLGDPTKGAMEKNAVLSATFANGGDETNILPGIEYFAELTKVGNRKLIDNTPANIQKGEIPIGIFWDFQSLGYRKEFGMEDDYEVVIPSDGAAIGAYVSIINKYAPHPYAARLLNDHLYSDESQINYAKGFARPIRKVDIPEEIKKELVPEEQYKAARPVKDQEAWEKTQEEFAQMWQEKVIGQ